MSRASKILEKMDEIKLAPSDILGQTADLFTTYARRFSSAVKADDIEKAAAEFKQLTALTTNPTTKGALGL